MKKILLTAIVILLVSNSFAQNVPYSPCTDSLFMVLKKKSLNEMNEREFNYFTQKDKECSTFLQLKQQEQKTNEIIRQQQSETDKIISDSKKAAKKGYAKWFLGWGIALAFVYFVTKIL